jgi:hypothetical protein
LSWILGSLNTEGNALELNFMVETSDTGKQLPIRALIDSGATGNFVSREFVYRHDIFLDEILDPIPVTNADGSANQGGPITHNVSLWIESPDDPPFRLCLTFEVTDVGTKYDVILGYPWLKLCNPEIDWKTGHVSLSDMIRPPHARSPPSEEPQIGAIIRRIRSHRPMIQRKSDDDLLDVSFLPPSIKFDCHRPFDILRDAHSLNVMTLGDKFTAKQDMRKYVPSEYWKYKNVFLRAGFDKLPPHTKYDHEINLLPGFQPHCARIYPLSPLKELALKEFIDENLSTGRIRHSKSPQSTPFFFGAKEPNTNTPDQDAGLRPIIDYRYLNSWTV